MGIIVISFSVEYKVVKINGIFEMIFNLLLMLDRIYIDYIEEFYIEVIIILFNEYIGNIMDLC